MPLKPEISKAPDTLRRRCLTAAGLLPLVAVAPDLQAQELTDLARIRANGVLKVAVYKDNAPFSSGPPGAMTGLDVSLAQALARQVARPACPDLLIRHRNTRSQEGRDRDGRFRNVEGAFRVRPGRDWVIAGRPVLMVDDVMTSGATLSACTEACLAAGAARVDVVVLCRVAKEA